MLAYLVVALLLVQAQALRINPKQSLIPSFRIPSFPSITTTPTRSLKALLAPILVAFSLTDAASADPAKTRNLSPQQMSHIIAEDISIRQALITADFSRAIYSEACQFQDEIDVYPMDQYVKGTSALFDARLSHVDLTSEVTFTPTVAKADAKAGVEAGVAKTEGAGAGTVAGADAEAGGKFRFRFQETLAWGGPFKPKVKLSGRVELTRGEGGLVVYSREFWDKG
ncbi:hypothetical protein B484DRAFT_441343, partial [Ochromonadaceae sp. CCMP2298]